MVCFTNKKAHDITHTRTAIVASNIAILKKFADHVITATEASLQLMSVAEYELQASTKKKQQ